MHRVGERIGDDERDRAGHETHHDRSDAVEQPSEDGRARHPEPLARQAGERGPRREDGPATGCDGSHPRAGGLLTPEEFGEPHRLEDLEDDHGDRPGDLGEHQPLQDAARPHQPQAVPHDHRGLLGRGGRPTQTGDVEVADAAWLLEQEQDHDEVQHGQAGSAEHGQPQRGLLLDRVPRDETARQQGARSDRDADDRPVGGQGAVDVRVGLGGMHGVDEPRLERTGVERPEDARQGGSDHERGERMGHEQGHGGQHAEGSGGHVDRSPSERVREAGGRQLEQEDHDAGERHRESGLADGEAPLEDPEHEDADDEPDGEPPGAGQDEEDAARGGRAEHAGHDRWSGVGGRSRSSG